MKSTANTHNPYPYAKLDVERENAILWIFDGEWRALDNFYHAPFVWNNIQFDTVEHAFQYAKVDKPNRYDGQRAAILAAAGPSEAKALGQTCNMSNDWDEAKFPIMRELLRLKFSQNDDAMKVLMATGERRIVEGNTWGDHCWGMIAASSTGRHLVGHNALGHMLMDLRANIRCEDGL